MVFSLCSQVADWSGSLYQDRRTASKLLVPTMCTHACYMLCGGGGFVPGPGRKVVRARSVGVVSITFLKKVRVNFALLLASW